MMRKKKEKNSEAIVDLKHSCEILDLVLFYLEATMHLQINTFLQKIIITLEEN